MATDNLSPATNATGDLTVVGKLKVGTDSAAVVNPGDLGVAYIQSKYGGSFGGQEVWGVGTPTDPGSAANKAYVDSKVASPPNEVQVANTSPSDTAVELWVNPTEDDLTAQGGLYVAKAGDTMTGPLILQAAPVVAMGAATKAFVESTVRGRNRIINGDFSVNQRGYTSSTTTATYGLDRWFFSAAGGTVTYSAVATAPGDLPESARTNARLASTGQSAAGDLAILQQSIESVRTLSGKTVTVSFWAKAASGTPKVAVEFSQNFGTGGSPSLGGQTYAGQVTLSTTWTRYSVSVALPGIAGKTLGSNGDDKLTLNLWTSAGSNFNARTGSLGIQNNTFDFWGVQVEEGPAATTFEQKSYAEELRACQRYYWRVDNSSGGTNHLVMGVAASATQVFFPIMYPTRMRTIPALTSLGIGSSDGAVQNKTGGTLTILGAAYNSEFGCLMLYTTTGATVHWPEILTLNGAGSHFAFSAEL